MASSARSFIISLISFLFEVMSLCPIVRSSSTMSERSSPSMLMFIFTMMIPQIFNFLNVGSVDMRGIKNDAYILYYQNIVGE